MTSEQIEEYENDKCLRIDSKKYLSLFFPNILVIQGSIQKNFNLHIELLTAAFQTGAFIEVIVICIKLSRKKKMNYYKGDERRNAMKQKKYQSTFLMHINLHILKDKN